MGFKNIKKKCIRNGVLKLEKNRLKSKGIKTNDIKATNFGNETPTHSFT